MRGTDGEAGDGSTGTEGGREGGGRGAEGLTDTVRQERRGPLVVFCPWSPNGSPNPRPPSPVPATPTAHKAARAMAMAATSRLAASLSLSLSCPSHPASPQASHAQPRRALLMAASRSSHVGGARDLLSAKQRLSSASSVKAAAPRASASGTANASPSTVLSPSASSQGATSQGELARPELLLRLYLGFRWGEVGNFVQIIVAMCVSESSLCCSELCECKFVSVSLMVSIGFSVVLICLSFLGLWVYGRSEAGTHFAF